VIYKRVNSEYGANASRSGVYNPSHRRYFLSNSFSNQYVPDDGSGHSRRFDTSVDREKFVKGQHDWLLKRL
jgi:hypothetical protein